MIQKMHYDASFLENKKGEFTEWQNILMTVGEMSKAEFMGYFNSNYGHLTEPEKTLRRRELLLSWALSKALLAAFKVVKKEVLS